MTCPICSRKPDAKYRPFCSRRCADVDLGRWLNGNYAIPSTDPDDLDEVLDAQRDATDETQQKPH